MANAQSHCKDCPCYACEVEKKTAEKLEQHEHTNKNSVAEFRVIMQELQPLVNYLFEFLRSKNNVIHAFDNSHLNLREIEVCTNLLSVLNQNVNETRLTAHMKTELLQRISKQLGIPELALDTTIKS